MRYKKVIDTLATILLFIGFFFAFLPHATHTAMGLDDETSHLNHVVTGIILVVIALVALVYNSKATASSKRKS